MSDAKSPKTARQVSRRELLKTAALTGVGLGLPGLARSEPDPSSPAAGMAAPDAGGESVMGMKFTPMETVRLGIIGVGGRGTSLLREFVDVEGVKVNAVCDLVAAKTENA